MNDLAPDDEPNPLCYEDIKELARTLRRPIRSLLAQSPQTDPFYAGVRAGRRDGEWFAACWHRIGFGIAHIRRIHYAILSQAEPVITPSGEPYENTDKCEKLLDAGSRAARHLGLVPRDKFEDRRNDEPILHIVNNNNAEPVTKATAWVDDSESTMAELDEPTMTVPPFPAFPEPPRLVFSPPRPGIRYLEEVWAEKTTMNDVLLPLAEQHRFNLVTGAGQLSITRCHQLIERARETGLPVRINTITDFDPSGHDSIPLALARKVEYEIRTLAPDLDVQVRAIVLTHDQCVRYRLPRIPLKETENRAPGWEQRYGEGATELDALEALRPGELARIVLHEVNRYRDLGLPRRLAAAARRYQAQLDAIEAEVYAPYQEAIADLRHEYAELKAAHAALVETWGEELIGDEIADFNFVAFDEIRQQLQDFSERAERQWSDLANALRAVDLPTFDWPQPKPADEDDDPLYDSCRSYLDQIARYKRHQGKPLELYRRKKFFIPAEIAEMRALKARGLGMRAIAKHFGVTRNAITYHLNPKR
jgi:hypothetical protein